MNFRHFFRRGLALLLPTVLTLWLVVAAYGFVQSRIAGPINAGVRRTILLVTPYPRVTPEEIAARQRSLAEQGTPNPSAGRVRNEMQGARLSQAWRRYGLLLDLIGLVVAVGAIYMVGALVGSFIGRRAFTGIERCITRVPLVRQVYPAVKQVTEFVVGSGSSDQKFRFSRVVAVQMSDQGPWLMGLVTGQALPVIQDLAGRRCLTVFVPTTPTPVTGFVIMTTEDRTLDLPLTIDDAVKFVVSAGVITPLSAAPPPRSVQPIPGIDLAGATVS